MNSIGDYNLIMSDHNLFNQVVYTPLSEALILLDARRNDIELCDKIKKLLNGNIPEVLKTKKCAVLSRHVATLNKESSRFISLALENNLHPVFFEYHEDKFTSNNQYKHSLGALKLYNGLGKKGGEKMDSLLIFDFNHNGGKKFCDIKTDWSESLIDFHRRSFLKDNIVDKICLMDASNWFKKAGGTASSYYRDLLLLFVTNGILFENFLVSENSEGDFTRSIVLPALDKIITELGIKPLIVPSQPFDMETDNFWYYHSPDVKNLIPQKKYV